MAMSQTTRDAIAAANEQFMAAFQHQDAAGLAQLYTENAYLLPPNSDVLAGKQAIQSFWQGLMDMGVKALKLDIIEVEDHRDTAVVETASGYL